MWGKLILVSACDTTASLSLVRAFLLYLAWSRILSTYFNLPILTYSLRSSENTSYIPFLASNKAMASSRAFTIGGGLLAAAGGYYLYSAGGDPKLAEKKAECAQVLFKVIVIN